MILGTLQPPETWDAAAALADRRTQLELDLIGSVLANPRAGVAACQLVAFDFNALQHDDLRLMYVCAEEFAHRGRSVVCRLVKRALCTSGHWDGQARAFERGHRWSDLSLASLACSFPSAADAGHLAKRLMELDRVMRAADAHFKAGVQLLMEVA